MRFLAFYMITAASLAFGSPISRNQLTPSQKEKVDFIESLATPLAERKYFYHYGSKPGCDAAISEAGYSGEIAKRYGSFEASEHAVAGHGFYVADNLVTSKNFFNGGLVEVALEKGTKLININDTAIKNALKAMGISTQLFYDLPLNLVVYYNQDFRWYVVKGAEGVSFREFDPTHIPFEKFGRSLQGISPDIKLLLLERTIGYPAYHQAILSSFSPRDLGPLLHAIRTPELRAHYLDRFFNQLHPVDLLDALKEMTPLEKADAAQRLLLQVPPDLFKLKTLIQPLGSELPNTNQLYRRVILAIIDESDL